MADPGGDAAPLRAEEWEALTAAVVRVARRHLVGRRLLPLAGPLGGGVEILPYNAFAGPVVAGRGMLGEDEAVLRVERRWLQVPILFSDFDLFWRDLESSRRLGVPLDTGAAEQAARAVAEAEDELIVVGQPERGITGLAAIGEPVDGLGDGFDLIAGVLERMHRRGFSRPFSVLSSPPAYARWHRLYGASGVLEVEQIARLVDGGVFVSRFVPEDRVIVLAAGPDTVDLVVGTDLDVRFVESTALNHRFRVLETVAPRVKRPDAVIVARVSVA